MRESAVLPKQAKTIIADSLKPLRALLVKNIEAEKPRMPASAIADIIMTFFSGTSLEQNLAINKTAGSRKIANFMKVLRQI